MNFEYSFQLIKEKEYLEKIYNRINFENKNTQKQFETIYNTTVKYLLQNI